MRNEKYNQLITKLLNATSEGRLSWEQTNQDNEYQVTIGDNSVLISGPRRSIGFNVNLDMENMSIAIVNVDGVEIDRQKVEPSDPSYNVFMELCDRVRKICYKVDETLQDIINEV